MSPDSFKQVVGAALGSWWCAYAFRYYGDLDITLDPAEKRLRWLVVAVGVQSYFLLPSAGGRVFAGAIWFLFLCWPNFAYYLSRPLRWAKLMRQSPLKAARQQEDRLRSGGTGGIVSL